MNTKLDKMERFVQTHDYRYMRTDEYIVIVIPWVAADGRTGEDIKICTTMTQLLLEMGY